MGEHICHACKRAFRCAARPLGCGQEAPARAAPLPPSPAIPPPLLPPTPGPKNTVVRKVLGGLKDKAEPVDLPVSEALRLLTLLIHPPQFMALWGDAEPAQ